jgi:hypothetical protein
MRDFSLFAMLFIGSIEVVAMRDFSLFAMLFIGSITDKRHMPCHVKSAARYRKPAPH